MSQGFLGVYQRGLYGKSRFVWNQDSLGIIIRGLFQFHRSGRRLPLHLIAPHLRGLICEYVKALVCESTGTANAVRTERSVDNGYSNQADDHYERICHRWVRLPSLRAVLLKLQECSVFAHLVSTTEASYRSLHDDGLMPSMFYRAMSLELSRMSSSHPRCTSFLLPAIPRPSSEPIFGYCFSCGYGLAMSGSSNFIPRCCCLHAHVGGHVSLCSLCFDDYVDDL